MLEAGILTGGIPGMPFGGILPGMLAGGMPCMPFGGIPPGILTGGIPGMPCGMCIAPGGMPGMLVGGIPPGIPAICIGMPWPMPGIPYPGMAGCMP